MLITNVSISLSAEGAFAELWADTEYMLPQTRVMAVYKVQMEGV